MAPLEQKVYMFQKDHSELIKFLLSDPGQEARGNLFGLWTADGQPVIHIVSGKHSFEDRRDSDSADIVGKDFPLSYIGDWSYNRSLELRCRHRTKRGFLQLILSIDRSTQRVTASRTLQGHSSKPEHEIVEIKLLESESPFRHVKRMKEIDISNQLGEHTDTTNEMELFTSPEVKGSSFERNTLHNKWDDIDDSISRKARYLENTPQKFTKFATSYERIQRRDFKVFVYTEDLRRMEELVREYPHLETGGDLFGLWTTDGDAVIHVTLGPGGSCKRTGTSFYQDVPYLQRNGELLTQDYLLCHIGEWHSHHQLHLFEPSGGDSTTVINNYPRGAQGFLLIIANIESSGAVRLSPYLYTERSTHTFDEMGTVEPLNTKNPFNKITRIKQSMQQGREIKEYSQYSQPVRHTRAQQSLYSCYEAGSLALPRYQHQAQQRAAIGAQRQSTRPPWL